MYRVVFESPSGYEHDSYSWDAGKLNELRDDYDLKPLNESLTSGIFKGRGKNIIFYPIEWRF